MVAEPNNPRYWKSQWYSTKNAEEPWPGGWYWHDNDYNWSGPYESEREAEGALEEYRASEARASEDRRRARAHFALYYHPLSPHSQKVLVAIYEKNARFEPHIVDLGKDAERAQFKKLYAVGQLPVIVLNHGPVIPESSIIIEYMDGFGGPRLLSDYPDLARKARFKDRLMDLYLIEPIRVLREESEKPSRERNSERAERAREQVKAVYEFLEHELDGQSWANGEEFSLADCTAAAALSYAEPLLSYASYPRMVEYVARLEQRPSVRRLREEIKAFRANHRAQRSA
jgi:glutathione S-transferase